MGLSITESGMDSKVMTTEQKMLEEHEHKIEYLMQRTIEQEGLIRALEQRVLALENKTTVFM